MAHALCESRPVVGSSKKRSKRGWNTRRGSAVYIARNMRRRSYFGCQFNGDSGALAEFDVQRSDNRVDVPLETTYLQYGLDTGDVKSSL